MRQNFVARARLSRGNLGGVPFWRPLVLAILVGACGTAASGPTLDASSDALTIDGTTSSGGSSEDDGPGDAQAVDVMNGEMGSAQTVEAAVADAEARPDAGPLVVTCSAGDASLTCSGQAGDPSLTYATTLGGPSDAQCSPGVAPLAACPRGAPCSGSTTAFIPQPFVGECR